MKAIVLFTFIFLAFSASSQSLKDALYSGRLKADTGAVIRKGDSLKIQENMAQKIAADSAEIVQKMIADSIRKEALATAKQNAIAAGEDTAAFLSTDTEAATAAAEKAIPADNNKIWKSFIDSVTTVVKSEVVTSDKLKKGAYSVLIEYDIKPDGVIDINSVKSDPQNSFLEGQIKVRLTLDAPQLNPVIGANGKPRTVARKQLLSFVK
jgi:hypothetical protein